MKPPAESQTAQPLLLGGIRPIAVDPAPVPAMALRLLSDRRLARLAAKGDRAAFGVVFDRYHRELYRYCLSLLRDPDDASDALQSAMVRALNALEGETREIALRPWLYRIAHNESMNLIRRRPPAGAQAELQPAALHDVEASAESRAALGQLLDDIRALPERQRGALVMRELGGLEYSEIATALDTSPAAAKQAIYEARRALFELAKGRDMECDGVRRMLSDGDGRTARGRALRAHLRGCTDCRDFQALTATRRSTLASLVPGMPVAAASVVRGLIAGGGSSGASGLGAVAGLTAPAAVKSITTIVAAVAVGAGAASVLDSRDAVAPTPQPAISAPAKHESAPAARQHAGPATQPGERARAGERRSARPATRSTGRHDAGRSSRGADARQPGLVRPDAPAGAPQAQQHAPQASAPAHQQQQSVLPIHADTTPVAGVPVVEDAVPAVTTQVESVTDTVANTVNDVQSQLPVRTPQILRKRKPRG
jgi:RNA polymerase sigma factor (sigma-70 family)